jgi:hypothetical protein
MRMNEVRFSIAAQAAWAPGVETAEAWSAWANAPHAFVMDKEPAVRDMPAMLRRRAGFLGKMALEVAYQCLAGRTGIPTVFCSRHGEVARSVELLTDLSNEAALSPTNFGLAVHNASAGLFSIARADKANHIALAAGQSSIEHAVIEACSLLADGEPEVLLVAYENRLPQLFDGFEDCDEQAYAWAWLMVPAAENVLSLSWQATGKEASTVGALPPGLQVLQFYLQRKLQQGKVLERADASRQWRWTHHG